MRHGRKFKHLSRKSAHRKAILTNIATSPIMQKSISNTDAKATKLRQYVEQERALVIMLRLVL